MDLVEAWSSDHSSRIPQAFVFIYPVETRHYQQSVIRLSHSFCGSFKHQIIGVSGFYANRYIENDTTGENEHIQNAKCTPKKSNICTGKETASFLLLRATKNNTMGTRICEKKIERQNQQTPGWQSRAE
jgi:hypothetical protein